MCGCFCYLSFDTIENSHVFFGIGISLWDRLGQVDRKEGPMPIRLVIVIRIRIGIIWRGGERGVACPIAPCSMTRVAAGNDGGGTAIGGWPPFVIVIVGSVDADVNAERADYELLVTDSAVG